MEVKLISLEVSGHLTIIITFWKVGDPITMLVTKYGLIMTNCKLSIFVCQSVQQKPALSFVSVLDKYGPLSNCERSIFVHWSMLLLPSMLLSVVLCYLLKVSVLSLHCLIASEAYLSTGVWSRAHFPAPLEQPLVGSRIT